MIWFPWSHRVSPVVVSLRPAMATMSPVTASFTSSRELACICSRRPMRSFLPFTELYAYEPRSRRPSRPRGSWRASAAGGRCAPSCPSPSCTRTNRGHGVLHVLAGVGVHLQQAADALLLALHRVVRVRTSLEFAGIHAQEGERAHEGIRHDL